MIKVESSVVINKPVAEVFAFTSNLANYTQWQVGVESVKYSEGTPKVGSQHSELRKFMGRDMETKLEITEWKPNEKYAAKTLSGPVPYEVTITYEAVEGGTKVTTAVEGEPSGFFKLAASMVASQLEKNLQESGQKLKAILEGV